MCGVVAIISKNKAGFFQTDKSIFLQMLISDMWRGMDSTGVFGVNEHGNLDMIKDASAAPFFINKKESTTFFNKFIQDYHIVVGHNRKATMGQVTSENAHPFIEGNICLIHNGTLTNHKKLADTTVDSHAICHHINEHGYKSALKNIEGAYTLIWYDASQKTLFFARNSERPLYLVETNDKIYLASEGKMLDWILDRNNISKYQVQNVPTDRVFRFSLESRKLESESKPKKEVVSNVKPMVTWTPTTSHHHHQNSNNQTTGLVHSLHHSSIQQGTASIETYKSGEAVPCKVVDFDINSASYKLICETLDGLATHATVYLSMSQYTQKEVDDMINAERLTGTIASITQKKGIVQLYLKGIKHNVVWKARGDVEVDPIDLEEAGGACYSCGTVLNRQQDIEFAEVTMNKHGNITYILCEHCADSVHPAFRNLYAY